MIGRESIQIASKNEVERYFHAYFESLHFYAFTILKDNDTAKDAVQAAFVKLWEKRATLDEQKSIKAYLYKSVYNNCLNIIRHEKLVHKHTLDHSQSLYTNNLTITKETNEAVWLAIEALPPQCKLVFCKSRFEDKKYSEIAEELNLSVKTVEAQIGKALKSLRLSLADYIFTLLFVLYSFFEYRWLIDL